MYNLKNLFLAAVALAIASLISVTAAQQGQAETLTVWHYFSADTQVQELKDLATLFNKTHPNVKVNYVYVPYNQLNPKVIAAGAAGTGPDVVIFNSGSFGQLATAGVLADMTSYWNVFADKDQFSKAVVRTLDGKVYGVQGYVNLLGLWYNKDILDKVGVTPPSTIDELTADLKKVAAAKFKGITLTGQANDQGEWQAYPWMTAYGWSYEDPQASACTKSFSAIDSWVKNGYLSPIAATWGQTQPFQRFLVGDVAFAENGNWQIGAAQANAKFNYGVVPMPAGTSPARIYLGGEAESIGAYSKNPDLAWEYLKDTYFSEAGQLIALKDVGSIPSRKDAAANEAVSSDPLLAPFGKEVLEAGAAYPPNVGSSTQIIDAELAVAQQWSAIIAGQKDPVAACEQAVSGVKSALAQ